MLTYETHKHEIEDIFKLINSGKFYSLTFVKKGDGQLRYLNGHRKIYTKPDGSEEVVKNIGYDPKNYNLIRVFDRNAENPYTKQKTGNYRSAALENIIFVKSGSQIFDFTEENNIRERFPYISIDDIKSKMKIQDVVDEEIQKFYQEGVADKYAERQFHIPDPNTEMDAIAQQGIQNDSSMGEFVGTVTNKSGKYNVYKNPKNLQNFDENVRAFSTTDGDLYVAQTNGDYFHQDMANVINDPNIGNVYDDEKNICWHRVGKTNYFGFSVSYISFGENSKNKEFVEKLMQGLKIKNPNFKFIPIYWQTMLVNMDKLKNYDNFVLSKANRFEDIRRTIYGNDDFAGLRDYMYQVKSIDDLKQLGQRFKANQLTTRNKEDFEYLDTLIDNVKVLLR